MSFRDNIKNYKSLVIPAGIAGIQSPWMAFVMHALTDFYTRFYWMQCNIDEYIPVLWIPAVHAGMTALGLVLLFTF